VNADIDAFPAPPLAPGPSVPRLLTTAEVPRSQRQAWLREVIGREYADVEIEPPADAELFNEMQIRAWNRLQLSSIRSNALIIERPARDPRRPGQDAFFAVLLVSGRYFLEQAGRKAELQPGDMALYDATRPHRIVCPEPFTKLIVSVPRALMRERVAGVDHCTGRAITGNSGIGAVVANLLRSTAAELPRLSAPEFAALSEPVLELLALASAAIRPAETTFTPGPATTLIRIMDHIERHLSDPDLSPTSVSTAIGLSTRYINLLLESEGTSLMRYVWDRRLERCLADLLSPAHRGHSLGEIAFRWGFNDLSHFNRAFKRRYGCPPGAMRQHGAGSRSAR
jgi:AraC family transcriptional regulator, positive regulator of tynA and feaB